MIHDLNAPNVDKWEPDEARDILDSTAEEQNEILAEKNRRAAGLRRKIGNTDGLVRWFVKQLHSRNPDVVELFRKYQCFWHEVRNTFTINKLRFLYIEGGVRRSSRVAMKKARRISTSSK